MHVGWEWASQNHDLTVIDDAGTIKARFAIGHDEASLEGVLRELASIGDPSEMPVAIERPDGIIVERLLAAGHPVVAVHPNSFHAARSRWGAGRAKSDPADSYMLADYLRTDGHRLRRLRPLDSTTRELQALVRMRDDHVTARTAATNQL
ncbi:MAG: IS110 family transposase, partial [Actinomycetota bacterium]|nr:IS110 family transposase [Actinomycetota bacterium]